MKVYVVTGFKKDKETGYNLVCMIEVFKHRDNAEAYADSFDGFATVTTKTLHVD